MRSPRRAWAVDAAGRPRRGVFLVPSLLTVANLFLGYFAIVKALDGAPVFGAALVLVAGVMDKLDGLVARATKTESEFGRELDSLADAITFGVAPALLAYAWGLQALGKVGWIVAFVFLACGTLRLARFNVMAATTDKRYFVGLPIPVAAAVPMSLMLAVGGDLDGAARLESRALQWGLLGVMMAVALLMVSRIRFLSFKDVHFGRQQRLLVLLGMFALIVGVAAWPGPVLSALAAAYALHGPALRALGLVPHAAVRRWAGDPAAETPSGAPKA